MNIGVFTDAYTPQINGVVTSTRMLESELTRLGHTVYVFTASDPHARQPQPRVFRMPSMPVVFAPSFRLTLIYPPRLLVRMKRFKLDIIHTQTEFSLGLYGKLTAEFLNLPLVHTYHTMYANYTHYVANGHLFKPGAAKKFSRVFCNRADCVIAPVEKTRLSLMEYGVKRPIAVIPTGIDFEPFRRGRYSDAELNRARLELGIGLKDPVMVFVGRVAKEKSIDVILKAMPAVLESLPQAKFLIVGEGGFRDELERLADELGVKSACVFAGNKPWDTIGKYYQLGDVFVTASTSESQGLTYIEAMAAGVAVVAKRDMSIEGVIVDGVTGYLFESDDDAAASIIKALADAEGRRDITQNALESISPLSSRRFGKNLEALYEDVIEKYKERGSRFPKLKFPKIKGPKHLKA